MFLNPYTVNYSHYMQRYYMSMIIFFTFSAVFSAIMFFPHHYGFFMIFFYNVFPNLLAFK